jgi:hypothetical protein
MGEKKRKYKLILLLDVAFVLRNMKCQSIKQKKKKKISNF